MAVPNEVKAHGVVPKRNRTESVIRNPEAGGWFVFIDVADSVDAAGAQDLLRRLHEEAQGLRELRDNSGRRQATLAIAVGSTFFTTSSGTVRVAPSEGIPAGLASPPLVPNAAPAAGDLFLYLMATADEVAARFLQRLVEWRPAPIASLRFERGFQRTDGREWFGYRDGVRNVPADERDAFVWVDPERFPEEPDWAAGGTYVAYMKVRQNLEVAKAMAAADLDQTVGRRADGSRLDLPAGTEVKAEPDDTSALPAASHVRKAGPRGELRDEVRVFRRGLPYQEMSADGLHAGLQFASFQPSADYFKVILNRWMLNNDFPTPAVGQDALISRGAVAFEKAGFYFVLPEGQEFMGQQMFQAADPKPRPERGRIAIRKRLVDANGAEVQSDLANFRFRVTDSSGAVVADLRTNAAGHTQTDQLSTGATYQVEEVDVPATVTADPPQQIALEAAHVVVTHANHVVAGSQYSTQ